MSLFYFYKNKKSMFNNIKYLTCMFLVLILTGCSSFDDGSSSSSSVINDKSVSTKFEDVDLVVSKDNIMTTIKDISTTSHPFGTDEEKKVASYLKETLESYDYDVMYQDFEVFDLGEDARRQLFEPNIDDFLNINPNNSTISKGIARNVIATHKDFDTNNKTLYITCHYDTTKRTSGVYDNSTGVSSVLEISRVLQNFDNTDFNLVFAFFSAEEYFRLGSRYHLSELSPSERDNILGAINVDMIGYSDFEYKDFPKIGDVEILLSPFIEKDALEVAFNEYFDNKYNVDNNLGGMSDDLSFARLSVPTISFADKNFGSGFEIECEDFETQFAPVNVNKISDLCEDICLFILENNI